MSCSRDIYLKFQCFVPWDKVCTMPEAACLENKQFQTRPLLHQRTGNCKWVPGGNRMRSNAFVFSHKCSPHKQMPTSAASIPAEGTT